MSKMAAKDPNDYAEATDRGNNSGSSDNDLQLKKRARRRLVGAIALALFAIIVLPLVMDREPAPVAPEIQVRIPSPDAGGTIGGKLAAVPSKPLGIVVGNAAKAEPSAATAEPAVPASVSVTEPKAPAAKPADAGKVSPPAPVEPAAAKPAEKEPTKPAAKEEPPAKEAPAGNGKWVVQLGAYQSLGNVAVLLAKLKEIRIPAYTEKFDSPQGPRTRVRAGPFASKEAATAAQKRIRVINVDGPVAPMSAK